MSAAFSCIIFYKGEPMKNNSDAAAVKMAEIKAYFDARAKRWDAKNSQDPKKLHRIADACDIRAGHKVLDAACGTGVLFPYLLQYNLSRLHAVDVSEKMIRAAHGKCRDQRLSLAPVDLLQLTGPRFHRVVMYNAYPHFLDKAALAKKMHSLMRRGGRFVLAHGSGRHAINSRHKAHGAKSISAALRPLAAEQKWFSPWFDIDQCVETDDILILSGTKK